jgi:hypothetical protein
MPSYRVCFINEIPREGRLFRCCQRSIVIRRARSPERALEAAKKRFARLEGCRDWKIRADMIEMEEIDLAGPAARRPGLASVSAGRDGHCDPGGARNEGRPRNRRQTS